MTKKNVLTTGTAGVIVGTAFLTAFTGCMVEGSGQRSGYRGRPAVQTTVVFEDDYDYYPGYEVYYSRNRREYVYRDGNTWVRRAEPRGITVDVLLAAPSVRVDFRDAPERHHSNVVRSYPRNWKRPDQKHDDRDGRKNDQDSRRDDQKKDKKDRKDDNKRD